MSPHHLNTARSTQKIILLMLSLCLTQAGQTAILTPLTGVKQLWNGSSDHSCAIMMNGGLKCWGGNFYGQIGDGTTTSRLTPVNVNGLTNNVITVALGAGHSCALTNIGIKCWGLNNNGQLGDGTMINSPIPVNVGVLTNMVTIAVGGYHSCALTTSGVQCWGYNCCGQVGDNTQINNRLTPVNVKNLVSVTAIALGGSHSCALTMNNGIKCWGLNNYGQLGDGTITNRLTPIDVSDLTNGVQAIGLGGSHSCALTTIGGVKCWGNNSYGQLGNSTMIHSSIPVDINGLTGGVVAIAVGPNHTCALTLAGGVQCWGRNSHGQLGDGTITNSSIPVNVNGLMSGVTSITLGLEYSCAIMENNGIKCWGYGYEGQLGDNTVGYRLTPVDVLTFTNADIELRLNITPTPLNGLIESGTLDKDGLFLADGQIQCGTNRSLCTKKDALMNTQVTLQATPDSGYLFTGWNGDCQNLQNPATLTIDQAKTCSANFMPPDPTITLSVEVERISGGEGFVRGTLIDEQNKTKGSPIIDCGKDCDENLSQAQKIRLTAVPGSTSTLTQWTCNGQALSKRENLLTLQQDLTCTTRFEKDQDTSSLTLSKTGQGHISAKRQGEIATELSCTSAGTCQVTKNFSSEREVKVTTTPDAGFMTRWVSGSCRPDPKNPNRATLPANSGERSCHVEFVRDETMRTMELSVQTNGEGVITGNIQGSAYGQLYCEGKEPCKNFYLPGTVVRLNAIPGPFSAFKGWQGCQTTSSSSLLLTLPQSGEQSCTAVFGERSEKTVEQFCKRIGEGGGYMMQGTQKIPVSNTFQCTSASNRARLQEAFRLAYPVKMMMEMHQLVTQTWPDHFASKVASWYHQYPPEIKNIRAMKAGNVEIQLNLKDEHDVEQLTTISYGTSPTGEAGTILFKRSEAQFQRLYNLAGEVRRDFAQKLNNNAQVMALYKETENQTRLRNAFWLAFPALMTAEENLRLGNEWPESFNEISWYDPQPPWKVSQARANHTRGFKEIKFLAGRSLEIQLVVLNNNHQEEEVSVLVYYGDPPYGGILYPRGK